MEQHNTPEHYLEYGGNTLKTWKSEGCCYWSVVSHAGEAIATGKADDLDRAKIEAMVAAGVPLIQRPTLFWHGLENRK